MSIFASDFRQKRRNIPDQFPVDKIRRVERPTTNVIEDQVQRQDERAGGFQRAGRGEYGPFLQHEYERFVTKHPLSAAQRRMIKYLADIVSGPVREQRAPLAADSEAMARHIKDTAYFLRADAVGICHLPKYAVFTHSRWDDKPIELDHRYAIAILVDQDWRTAAAFSGHDWISNAMSFLAYSTSGFIACILAEYIRQLGYPARAHHAMNYQVLVPPILLWAGLGEMCRIGDIVLNPFLGPRFKAAVVTTDLPLAVDKPIDFGLQHFCARCGKCARECPAQAISPGEKVLAKGYERWPCDVEKCTAMRVGNQHGSGCGTCIKVCPWNKPYTSFHRFIGWSMRHFHFLHPLAVWGDDLLGFGKAEEKSKWWLDLEDVDGRLRDVSARNSV